MPDIVTDHPTEWQTHLPFETDGGVASRARIGVVTLATDHTLEYDFRRLLDLPGVAFYVARIPFQPEVTPETLAGMEQSMAATASLILPGVPLTAIVYGCSSATMVLGEETVFARLREGRGVIPPTTPVTAAFAAFNRLDKTRIALLTPYVRSVNEEVANYFRDAGYDVPVLASYDCGNDNIVCNIPTDTILRDAIALGRRDDVDAVFISCTSLRTAEIIAQAEAETGKPVTSSNHAMAWHALRLSGVSDRIQGQGSLFLL